jgi:hypothetical protein
MKCQAEGLDSVCLFHPNPGCVLTAATAVVPRRPLVMSLCGPSCCSSASTTASMHTLQAHNRRQHQQSDRADQLTDREPSSPSAAEGRRQRLCRNQSSTRTAVTVLASSPSSPHCSACQWYHPGLHSPTLRRPSCQA